MPRFSYEVKGPTGEIESGTIEGESSQAAARTLQAKGYFVVKLRPQAGARAAAAPDLSRRALAPIFYPVSSKSRALFFTSLRALLSAGMNVSEAMATLAQRTGSAMLAQAAREMAQEAARGMPMTSVMSTYPAAFDPPAVAVMEAGEESGLLEQTADRIARYYDRIFQLEQNYRWQTFYPKVLVVAAVLIPTVPQLVLGGFDLWLRMVLSRSLPLLAGVTVAWYGWRALRTVRAFSAFIDGLKLVVPWFGSLTRRMATARWARAMAMLLSAGVPVHRALVTAAAASGNKAMEESLVREAGGVMAGRSLTEVISASRAVPAMALDLLSAAERSGSFEEVLEKVAEYYESETEVGGKQTAMVVGVGLYLLIAAVIAFMVISFYSGYFSSLKSFME
jgi:type II secretory pathway component PulF